MKRRKLLWLALALLGTGCTMDTPDFETVNTTNENPYFVSVEEAIRRADLFFAQLDCTPGTRTQRVVWSIEVYRKGNPLTRSSSADPDFYVINYMDDGGFALMSTDSRKLPVYAFSTEGADESFRHFLQCRATPLLDYGF